MENKLDILVERGGFNKSVEDFGKNEFLFGNDASLIPGRLYFIKVRQPSTPGIDTIVMFKETKGNRMHFKQYYFRYRRLFEDDPYDPLLPPHNKNNIINKRTSKLPSRYLT